MVILGEKPTWNPVLRNWCSYAETASSTAETRPSCAETNAEIVFQHVSNVCHSVPVETRISPNESSAWALPKLVAETMFPLPKLAAETKGYSAETTCRNYRKMTKLCVNHYAGRVVYC